MFTDVCTLLIYPTDKLMWFFADGRVLCKYPINELLVRVCCAIGYGPLSATWSCDCRSSKHMSQSTLCYIFVH